jgi:hypothetical protein
MTSKEFFEMLDRLDAANKLLSMTVKEFTEHIKQYEECFDDKKNKYEGRESKYYETT